MYANWNANPIDRNGTNCRHAILHVLRLLYEGPKRLCKLMLTNRQTLGLLYTGWLLLQIWTVHCTLDQSVSSHVLVKPIGDADAPPK